MPVLSGCQQEAAAVSNQNRNVPLLTKIEMSPFFGFCFSCVVVRCSLSLPEAKPCGARRAERLGRSVGQVQRPEGRSLAHFLMTPLSRRKIWRQERPGATIPNSVDP